MRVHQQACDHPSWDLNSLSSVWRTKSSTTTPPLVRRVNVQRTRWVVAMEHSRLRSTYNWLEQRHPYRLPMRAHPKGHTKIYLPLCYLLYVALTSNYCALFVPMKQWWLEKPSMCFQWKIAPTEKLNHLTASMRLVKVTSAGGYHLKKFAGTKTSRWWNRGSCGIKALFDNFLWLGGLYFIKILWGVHW